MSRYLSIVSFLLSVFSTNVLAEPLFIPEGSSLSVKFISEQKIESNKSNFILMKPYSATVPSGNQIDIPDYCLSSGDAVVKGERLYISLHKIQCVTAEADILNADFRADLISKDGLSGIKVACDESCVLDQDWLTQAFTFTLLRDATFSIKYRQK